MRQWMSHSQGGNTIDWVLLYRKKCRYGLSPANGLLHEHHMAKQLGVFALRTSIAASGLQQPKYLLACGLQVLSRVTWC